MAGTSTGLPPAVSAKFPTQRLGMAPPPFFQGFSPMPNQMPFLFPHSFMPHVIGIGFPPPAQANASATIDLTGESHKRGPHDCVMDQSKTVKKRRALKKKPKIVELDDAKDDVEFLKNIGPWKGHWVIQLITIRGEMQNTFSAPPSKVSCSPFSLDCAFRACWATIYLHCQLQSVVIYAIICGQYREPVGFPVYFLFFYMFIS